MIYGDALVPGAPGTWQRDVWFALNRSARVGSPAGRHRFRTAPPFTYNHGGHGGLDRDLLVTAGRPRLPYGRSTQGRGYLTHVPHTILFAWHKGAMAGRMVAWWCGARTAYFRLIDEPSSPLCRMCLFRLGEECPV